MRKEDRCRCVRSLVLVAVFASLAASAGAQGRTLGEVTDEWNNGLEGATVLAEPDGASSGPQTTMTDSDGEFMFVGLSTGRWSFTVTLDGYQGIRVASNVRQLGTNRPIEFELPVLPFGSRFGERTEFEAEGGTPKFRFEDDGAFEFEDAEGEGKGTYGIVDLNAILTVRDYDGPDDKFSISTPVVVEFGDKMFTSMTHDGVALPKKQ